MADGIVFDVQRYSLQDGPGLRTLVFLKGCPLRCLWCSNPESQQPTPEILYDTERCLHCGACARACPVRRHAPGRKYARGRPMPVHRLRRLRRRLPGGRTSSRG
jgi:pyruvate-formate lyase-activating enzyme